MSGEIIFNTYHEGQEFDKTYPPEAAIWCNNNEHYIEEYPEGSRHYIIRKVVHTVEEYENSIRSQRDSYLTSEVDPIVCNPLRWSALSADEQARLAKYREYLLNIPQSEYFPYTDKDQTTLITVLSYEEWIAQL